MNLLENIYFLNLIIIRFTTISNFKDVGEFLAGYLIIFIFNEKKINFNGTTFVILGIIIIYFFSCFDHKLLSF